MKCKVDGCNREAKGQGLCGSCYSYACRKGLIGEWQFPSEPLRRCMRLARAEAWDPSWADFSERVGLSKAMVEGVLRRRRVRWTTVDEISIALGLHPILLYPDWTEVFDMDAYLERRRQAGLQAEALAS